MIDLEEEGVIFQKQAAACGMTIGRWLLELVEKSAPVVIESSGAKNSLVEILAKVRGLEQSEVLDTNIPSERIRNGAEARVNFWI